MSRQQLREHKSGSAGDLATQYQPIVVQLEDTRVEIEARAFTNCIGIREVHLNKNLQKIGNGAFSCCSSLRAVYRPKNPKDVVIEERDYNFEGLNDIGSCAFSHCTSLRAMAIPSTVKIIKSNTFFECSALRHVSISEGVIEIRRQAFSNCRALEQINTVSVHDFYDENAGEFKLPQSIETIEGGAFWGCTSLVSIQLPMSITFIDEYTFFECRGLTSIEIPRSVRMIGNKAFANCTALYRIVLHHNRADPIIIDSKAFDNCPNIKEVIVRGETMAIAGSPFSAKPGGPFSSFRLAKDDEDLFKSLGQVETLPITTPISNWSTVLVDKLDSESKELIVTWLLVWQKLSVSNSHIIPSIPTELVQHVISFFRLERQISAHHLKPSSTLSLKNFIDQGPLQ